VGRNRKKKMAGLIALAGRHKTKDGKGTTSNEKSPNQVHVKNDNDKKSFQKIREYKYDELIRGS
jgi:hypothetical protein